MAKSKAKTTKKKAGGSRRSGGGKGGSRQQKAPDTTGKHLVIVESPTKAKTINKYLGNDYVVMASVGHVRDLPKSAPKGAKRADHPVPGVDLEHDFAPTYEIMPDKKKTITELKKAAKNAADVWFATDLDREGEAIAWHLAQALKIDVADAKRVVFNAITKSEIEHAFGNPRKLELNRINAQQARRILDRIVGYQVSPLLWKKVAGGLSAGRVQSVAARLVVEREREIDAFVPVEFWKITAYLSAQADTPSGAAWKKFLDTGEDDKPRTNKDKVSWLNEHDSFSAELVQLDGENFKPDNRDAARHVAEALGLVIDEANESEDPKAKGPAKNRVEYVGHLESLPAFTIESIEKKRTTSRPAPPFITSTMQQAAANRMGFALQRTMRIAQQLYEGIDLGGSRGQTGLITYMRTDSTHLSGDALNMARGYIDEKYGDRYLPEKPNFFKSSNKDAQEAHEAIRPTDVSIHPDDIKGKLSDEQYKLYKLIWQRFVGCQMTPAQWDSTAVNIKVDADGRPAMFRATGRTLVFDGFYRVLGVPNTGDDFHLPELDEGQQVHPFDLAPTQHFTSPPPRYTEASLQKKLEEEGIGRPSTYAAIIQTIQNRKYVEPLMPRDRRLRATDLGMVVTDKLIEGFPRIMDVAYTREMESHLDEIEEENLDWVQMLKDFYERFKKNLDSAHELMSHAKAETQPAPYKCPECGNDTMYRFGKSGRFLSCSAYPECKYASPIDKEGKPVGEQVTDVLCPKCGGRMTKRKGRFGAFLGCENYPDCDGIINLDKKGAVKVPKTPPMTTDLTCPKCEEAPLYCRDSKRGLWLSCSTFPKCRGRQAFNKLDEDKQAELEKAWKQHEKQNPTPVVRTTDGEVIEEDGKHVPHVEAEEIELSTSSGGDEDVSVDDAAA